MPEKIKNKSYFLHDRTDVFKLVPKTVRRVLDVGCGVGVLGKRLKESGMEVTGIEKDEKSCKEAGRYLHGVICCDAEKDDPCLDEKYFDCIIYGDVLEHFYDPTHVLIRYKKYLKDDGIVIASMPNVRYYKVLIRLFCGTWDYVDSGILDVSHVRFFTLINIKEMFAAAGFGIESIKRNIVASRGFRVLNLIFLSLMKDFLTYQYYIVAKKSFLEKPTGKKRKIYKF
ncbi:MAG: class I SAM-dependent methyltransferase [Candidatus Omnitrophica bacterium]|nr:class I SAM-dependent methyltransferase [Candidatus Omnitrophota bacterium]MBU4590330.1 class I SAM-dependent methyltransferase [Candidatus Omnitrophota bacterium]